MNDILDYTLGMQAEILSDLERTRIANENRLRQMTRTGTDKDGKNRGFGLTEDHPSVAALSEIVKGLKELEDRSSKNLEASMKKNPLGPWVQAQKGLGLRQVARLLAVVGDPTYYVTKDGEIHQRSVGQLWQYCGHGGPSRLKRGSQVFWNPEAKMRLWNIASQQLKYNGPYRSVYDLRRKETEERLHTEECKRCGPSGNPAKIGTPWSKGHENADAIRVVGKEILRDMWIEAKRIHDEA